MQKTYTHVYAYGHDPASENKTSLTTMLGDLKSQAHLFVPTSTLAAVLYHNNCWGLVVQELKACLPRLSQGVEHKSAALNTPLAIEPVRLALRAFATLEMIAKDSRADVMVRRGDIKDFIASVILFERITLPVYF